MWALNSGRLISLYHFSILFHFQSTKVHQSPLYLSRELTVFLLVYRLAARLLPPSVPRYLRQSFDHITLLFKNLCYLFFAEIKYQFSSPAFQELHEMAPTYFPILVSFIHITYFSKMELCNLLLPLFPFCLECLFHFHLILLRTFQIQLLS